MSDATNSPAEEMVHRLLSAVAASAGDERIDQLIVAARAEAETEIRAMLKSAIKATLLRRTVERLEGTDLGLQPAAAAEAGVSASAGEGSPLHPETQAPPNEGEAQTPPSGAPATDSSVVGEVGCYVYAITRAGPVQPATADDEGGTEAGRANPLRTVQYQDVQAIVASVPLEELARAGGDGPQNDPQWLEARVLAHDRVVKNALSAGPVIPCRFCTVIRDAENVRRLLARNYDLIAMTLSAFEGKEEWGVKIFARARHARERGAQTAEPAPGDGKAYLISKKRAEHDRGVTARAERTAAEACHRELALAACEAATIPPRAKAAGAGGKLLLNGTYLVADIEAFLATVSGARERYRPDGLSLELTGPWPPYNFVRLDLSAEPAQEVAA